MWTLMNSVGGALSCAAVGTATASMANPHRSGSTRIIVRSMSFPLFVQEGRIPLAIKDEEGPSLDDFRASL